MLAARLLPVSCTFSALTTMILSPVSMCGVKIGLCLPRRRIAMIVASRPSTSPSASITTHFLSISEGLAEKVFIANRPGLRRGQRRGAHDVGRLALQINVFPNEVLIYHRDTVSVETEPERGPNNRH